MKRFGERLAIINDTSSPRSVRLTFPKLLTFGTRYTDLGTGQDVAPSPSKSRTRINLKLEAWDLVTLEVKEMPDSNTVGK